MQIRSLPFWLMIVSIASAVLPVCRSPMISSRWPRPMGVIASIALMPVCTGVSTLLRRSITPGAMRSMLRNLVVTIGPLPSIGWPMAFTTRPISASPTGTETMRPVARTVWPSSISVYSPMMMTPTLSLSRLKAMPSVPFSNCTISLARTPARPDTRAMPSPTSRTVPTSTASHRGRKQLRVASAKQPQYRESCLVLVMPSALLGLQIVDC